MGLVYIDNYEEALDSTDDVRRSLLAGLIDKRVNKYFSPGSAIVRKLEKDKYIVVFRYNFLEKLMQDRFSLLEEIKSIKIGNEMTLTLSMGIGTGSAEYSKNYDVAKAREKEVRHDVMSHVYAYGVQCPKAKGIIHLGATSCYVGDNTDMIIMREGLQLVKKKLVNVIAELSKFADRYKSLPTLAFTHFQPAQPTTVGKRATLWCQEFIMDLEDLDYVLGSLKLLGSKGTTGTQASFQELFDGDQETIDKIDPMIAEKMGFKSCYPVSGQTYSRKVDTRVLNVLACLLYTSPSPRD